MQTIKTKVHDAAVYIGLIDPPKRELPDEILYNTVKFADVGYIFVIYFVCAIGLAMLVDKIFGKFDPAKYEKDSDLRLVLELLLAIWFFGIASYGMRELVHVIPYPFDNIEGHIHKEMKELLSTWIFSIVFFITCSNMSDRVKHIYNKFM
jgi:hypothetical protein